MIDSYSLLADMGCCVCQYSVSLPCGDMSLSSKFLVGALLFCWFCYDQWCSQNVKLRTLKGDNCIKP